MSKVFQSFRGRTPLSVFLTVVISVLIIVATVQASTTISTNITTGGTLTVTGAVTVDTNTFYVDVTNNRVGILTTAPNTELETVGVASSTQLVIGGEGTSGLISGIVFGTCTYNPGAAITGSTTRSTSCTGATGVRTTDKVFVMPKSLETHLVLTSASSTVAGAIQVSVYNTGVIGNISPTSATWNWMAIR